MSGRGARPKQLKAKNPQGNRRSDQRPRQEQVAETEIQYRRQRPIGFRKLQELVSDEPKEILSVLTNQSSGFRNLLQEDEIRDDLMALCLKAVSKALECTTLPQTRIVLLNEMKKSATFWTSCNVYVTSMPHKFLMKRAEFNESLKSLLKIFKVYLQVMPTTSEYLLPNLLVAQHIINIEGPLYDLFKQAVVDEEITILLQEMLADRELAQVKTDQKKKLEEGREVDHIPPPENFRQIPIFPVTDDVHANERPFLRANKLKGKYNDLEHYLDVQFRLLREDFMGPLRTGIIDYLEQRQLGAAGRRRLENIKVYPDVQLLCPVCTRRGIAYKLKFSTERLKNIRWQLSKRLIYGSLVCLSSDDFNTMIFATVSDRQAKDLETGVVEVIFSDNTRIPSTSDRFVMAESTAYFEAYRHVLQGVQNITDEAFPFQKYIVECDTQKAPPQYLNNGATKYDFTFLFEMNEEDTLNETLDPADRRALRNIPMQMDAKWPSETLMRMDKSQARAMKTALTQEFCVIQGPPGTGKTYVGLKVVQALLRNKHSWCTLENKRPILIVCYTNHALDQFLEGIMQFHEDGIVRVGGRSQSEEIKKKTLGSLKAELRTQRRVPRRIFMETHDVRNNMNLVRGDIEKVSVRLEATSKGLVKDLLLERFMSDDQYDSLIGGYQKLDPFRNKTASPITEWLCLGEHSEPDKKSEATAGGGQDAAQMEDDDIDVEEDAEMINAARHLDEDDEKLTEEEETRLKNLQRLKHQAEQTDLSLTIDQLDFLEAEEYKKQNKGATTGTGRGQGKGKQNEKEGPWQIQRKEKRRRKQRLKQGLSSTDAMTEDEAEAIRDVWAMRRTERWRLYRLWISKYKEILRADVKKLEEEYQTLANRFLEIGEELDREIMQDATIIGMTTTGAARYRALLQRVAPRIVIVEEAAEVLEAHLVTSISGGCEHFILIGDHKQLRPSPTVFELAKKYHLDISLFERMINNGMQVVTLAKQHRMRPQISTLMEPIYPGLLDDDSVHGRDSVKGVAKDMFFIDHSQGESTDEELKSKSNPHEAQYVAALCRYLLLQGYTASQITVLTMYSGQLMMLKHNMPKNIFQGIRVTTVDNFQGEENDIIILSLVRSNDHGQIGFVSSDNRICVALSRARLGLYCIGNFGLLTMKSTLWTEVMKKVEAQDCKGTALSLFCQNHPEYRIDAAKAEDFDQAPEGGCLKPCETRLECGHVCPRTCHSYDRDHKKVKCQKRCNQILCEKGHKCGKKCFEECGPCQAPMPKIIPGCQHRQTMACHKDPATFACQEACRHMLSCGHLCIAKCGQPHTTKCPEQVYFTGSCGHSGVIECHLTNNPPPCREPCGTLLRCEHTCQGTCGSCFQGRVHQGCRAKCGRTLVCGHSCGEPCTNTCPPCKAICQNRCTHSSCRKLCGEPCVRCVEPCEWQCEHYACTMLCSEPCDRQPCDEPCAKLLKCDHPCIGLCGEPCPKLCRICNEDDVTEIFFGTEDEEDARFVQLEDCGHVLEVSGLDEWMTMESMEESHSVELKSCPKCKTTIRRNKRYGTIINEALSDIENVKEKAFGSQREMQHKQKELQDLLKVKVGPYSDLEDSYFGGDELHKDRFGKKSSKSHDILRERLSKKHLTQEQLALIRNQIEFLHHMGQLKRRLFKESKSFHQMNMRVETRRLAKELSLMTAWCIMHDTRMSEQEVEEFNLEVKRVSWVLKFLVLQKVMLTKDPDVVIPPEFTSSFVDLKSGRPLTTELDATVKQSYDRLKKKYPDSGLAVTQAELQDIVRAVGLTQGHWFKCPKGHFYAIGECGGATQRAKCPECGENIGGEQHRLDAGNRHAPEIDGSRYAAWSDTANNMENFNPDDFN